MTRLRPLAPALLLALAALAPAMAADTGEAAAKEYCEPSGNTPFERSDVHAIAERIVCYCGCPHLQVSKCYCGTADEIRDDIAKQLDAKKSADEIIAAYVAEHGNWSLAEPPKAGFNWIIWVGPFVLLLLGTAVVFVLGRHWTRPVPQAVPAAASLPPEAAARYREQLQRALDEQD